MNTTSLNDNPFSTINIKKKYQLVDKYTLAWIRTIRTAERLLRCIQLSLEVAIKRTIVLTQEESVPTENWTANLCIWKHKGYLLSSRRNCFVCQKPSYICPVSCKLFTLST